MQLGFGDWRPNRIFVGSLFEDVVRGRSEIALEQENERGHHEPNQKLLKKPSRRQKLSKKHPECPLYCVLVTKRLCRATFEIAVTAGCLIIRSKEMA